MASPNELPPVVPYAANDTTLTTRSTRGDGTGGEVVIDAGEGSATSIATGDQGTSAYLHAVYDPIGIRSFEWGNLSMVGAVSHPVLTPVVTEEPGGVITFDQSKLKGLTDTKLQVAADYMPLPETTLNGSDFKTMSALVFHETSGSAPTASGDAGPLNAAAKRLIRNAETLLTQLTDVADLDLTSTAGLTRLRSALDAAQAFPAEPKTWENLYKAMLGLRSSMRVMSAGQHQAMSAAATRFSSDPARVRELLATLKLPDIKALQDHLKIVPASGVMDGQTFLALEMMLLEADAVSAGGMSNAAETVAHSQVTLLLGQASFVRDIQGTDVLTALKVGKLSEEAQIYLFDKGYQVDDTRLIDKATGKEVTAADLPALGEKLIGDATNTLFHAWARLQEDEQIHVKALTPEQQGQYQLMKTALNQVISETGPQTPTEAVAQIMILQGATDIPAGVVTVGTDVMDAIQTSTGKTGKTGGLSGWQRTAVTVDKPTLERWRSTGITAGELAQIPTGTRKGLETFLSPGSDGRQILRMSETEMNEVLGMASFIKEPPNEDAKALVTAVGDVTRQVQQTRALVKTVRPQQPEFRLSPAELQEQSLAFSAGQAQIPPGTLAPVQETRILPLKGRMRGRLRAGKGGTGPAIRPGTSKRPITSNVIRQADPDADRRTVAATSATGKPQSGQGSGQLPHVRMKDERDFTARLSANRFAQQVRNQKGLQEAEQERKSYTASLSGDRPKPVPVVQPLPKTPAPSLETTT